MIIQLEIFKLSPFVNIFSMFYHLQSRCNLAGDDRYCARTNLAMSALELVNKRS